MKILHSFVVTLLAVVPTHAAITFDFGAAELRTSTGDLMPSSGLVIVGASTLDSSFGALSPSAFFSGDDVEIFRLFVSSSPGQFGAHAILTLSDHANWSAGDSLIMYWFPTLTSGATDPGAGTSYGAFRTDSVQTGSDIAWVTPSDGATVALSFLTQSQGGDNPNSAGWASLTVVPEPVTWALAWFGGVVLAVGTVRRWRAKRS